MNLADIPSCFTHAAASRPAKVIAYTFAPCNELFGITYPASIDGNASFLPLPIPYEASSLEMDIG